MSIFDKILTKINTCTAETNKNFQDDLKNVFESLEKLERDLSSKAKQQRELATKTKNAVKPLQSINEDEDESKKTPDQKLTSKPETKKLSTDTTNNNVSENVNEKPSRNKKRSKDQVEDMHSPDQDKRPKRGASVRAQSNISKQVNQNLTQKLRRDEHESDGRPQKEQDSDKENALPVQIKQEKLSILPPEPMDVDLPQDIQVKQEVNKDDVAMPPPAAPVPKSRGRQAKNKQKEVANESSDESEGKRKSSRSRKPTEKVLEAMPPPPTVPSNRPTRASSRASSRTQTDEVPAVPVEQAPRPKRTHTKKAPSQSSQESDDAAASAPPSPDKPRPKRTRRGKATEKQQKPESPKPVPPTQISPKEERISVPDPTQNQNVVSPIIVVEKSNRTTKDIRAASEATVVLEKDEVDLAKANLEETRVISGGVLKDGAMCDFDKTVILPNGKYDHVCSTPKAMNETMVITKAQTDTNTVSAPANTALDATVLIEKAPQPQAVNMTDDNSLLTDDSDHDHNVHTPPANHAKSNEQPLSAVKEKVQQFEEMANRVTRTKTRAMAKKEESTENHTPPDKINKVILSADTLTKMNGLIFNGKAPQISSSASKPNPTNILKLKSLISSGSKIPLHRKEDDRSSKQALTKREEDARTNEREDARTKEREDARKKKEAILEAKREYNKRKREEKMAAAAAARSAAERERLAALEAAARDKTEKQAHALCNKQERLMEAEKKKLELNRKAAETEERRRAEERARALRLAEEQRAHTARTKQIEESLASKKEAVLLAKEIEKRQKEYIEKQKLKQKMEADKVGTPLRSVEVGNMPPVYMADGFEHLNSDNDDDEPVNIPAPWSTYKNRCQRLKMQHYIRPEHIDRLFSVRVHSPDLAAIFPRIERRYLKRTSSAVWRTPPHRVHY